MPLTTWESDFPNTLVQMMEILSRENKILFVDYEYTIKDILSRMDEVPVQRMLGLESRLRTLKTRFGSEIHVLTPPPVLPINWIKWKNPYRVLLQINSQLIKSSIRNAMEQLEMDFPIVVNGYNPFFGLPLAGAFDEILNIYFCYDEIKGDPFYSFHGPDIERDYIRKSDGVIVTSDGLLESKCPLHNSCYVVKNGVDFQLFNSVAEPVPVTDRKVIGYTGSVDERFDLETVKYAVESLPDYTFIFVGRITNNKAKSELEKYKNVEFTGGKKPHEVPSYLKGMSVCIIPYIKNDVTKGVYPLKVNEYLAAGKPVVMTDFANFNDFHGIVSVVDSKEKFLESLKREINTDTGDKVEARIKFASNNSWEQKVEEFSEAIEALRIKKFILK